MYQQIQDSGLQKNTSIKRSTDNAFIPLDIGNTDYQRFKTDLYNGVELLDPDGNTMTPEQVQEFLSTLP